MNDKNIKKENSMGPLSAGIMAGGSLLGNVVGGWMQNRANEKMNKENLRLAYIQRADQLNQNTEARGDALKQTAFTNKLAIQDRAYSQLQDHRNEGRQRMQDDSARRASVVSFINAMRGR